MCRREDGRIFWNGDLNNCAAGRVHRMPIRTTDGMCMLRTVSMRCSVFIIQVAVPMHACVLLVFGNECRTVRPHACSCQLGWPVGASIPSYARTPCVPRCDLDGSGRGLASSSLIAVQGNTIIILAAAGFPAARSRSILENSSE